MPTERENLFAYTEKPTEGVPYVGYASLNRETDGRVTLSVRSPGDASQATSGTITLPPEVASALAMALTLGGVEMVEGGLDPEVLVQRFLTWPVPADVYPDGTPGQPGRTGTNLLSAPQAKAMLQHVLGG